VKLLESLELIGPGRWLDRPVVDQTLQLQPAELRYLANRALQCRQNLLMLLSSAGLPTDDLRLTPPAWTPDSPERSAARLSGLWLAELGLILQAWAGHRVSWSDAHVLDAQDDSPESAIIIRAMFEIEDHSIASETAEIALLLVNLVLQPNAATALDEPLQARMAAYRDRAAARVLPWDAEVLIAAARARDIPVCKLDREPYEPIVGDFRLRQNGLLRFGHACYQLVVDGTLCLERSSGILPQLKTRMQMLQALRTTGAPVTKFGGSETGNLYRCFCSGQQLAAVHDAAGHDVTDLCHVSILEHAAEVAQQIPAGLMVLEFVSRDITLSLEETAGGFIALDISPQLDHLLEAGGELHRLLTADFVDWLFPEGQPFRIPLFSVTGTNGKTTTCRMLARIATQAGYRVGMACTDGIYLNQQLVDAGDHGGRDGHHRVLESREINFGVLETARGAVLHSGFSFDHSDVAICTNVTPEHLGEYGINSTEEMSQIKRLILQQACTAAVLNFDDAHCREMGRDMSRDMSLTQHSDLRIGRSVPRICWSACRSGAAEIEAQAGQADRIICLETHEGEQWIVSRMRGTSTRLMPLNEIPASFNGAAVHNVSNALQAIAAALELGIAWADIRTAMADFSMSIDATPGRLNIHHGPGFPVLMDFVQNIDGMRVLCEFVQAQAVRGKRILVMSVLGRHDNATVSEFARLAAQNFDYFICRNYGKTYSHRSKEEIPLLLREGLLAAGVNEQQIVIILDEQPAVNHALEMGQPGDLVVVLCGIKPRDTWQQISEFSSRLA
jgi:UDP-N-acetylmuramyl tripeptide synthase